MKSRISLSVTFIILYVSAWPIVGIGITSFFCFIPLLFLCDKETQLKTFVITTFTLFFVANSISIYWLYNLTISGGIVACFWISLLQSVPFFFRHFLKDSFSKELIFISSFLIVESLQIYMEFSFPIMTLGNALGSYPHLIQWYEFTGVAGGTLWILVTNLGIYHIFKKGLQGKVNWKLLSYILITITLPIMLSFTTLKIPQPQKSLNTVILHPSVDCYSEKYEISTEELLKRYMVLLKKEDLSQVDLLLWPENAITDMGWLSNITETKVFNLLKSEFKRNKNLNLISGAVVYALSQESDPYANYSRKFKQHFVAYNTAVHMNFGAKHLDLRAKVKLVPFEEYEPEGLLSSILSPFYTSLGKFNFTKKRISNRDLFKIENWNLLSLVCYEILYGNLINTLSLGKANGITLHMNEGWMNNRHSSKHFQMVTQIRAIEQKKSIVVASNMGTSSIISSNGEIINESIVKQPIILTGNFQLNNERTFYSKFGDWIAALSILTFIACGLSYLTGLYNHP